MAEPPAKKARTEEEDEDDKDDNVEDAEADEEGEEEDGEISSDDYDDPHETVTIGDADATAVVIWMHGLGDSPLGWAEVAAKMHKQLPHTKWILPCAPERPVTCNGGMEMTSWMDLTAIPITPSTPDNGKDLPVSIAAIHELIDGVVKGGVPASRVVLGGFSQGAALALSATLKYPKTLAGACVLSGWCPPKLEVPALAATSANKATPFLVCHGDADATVRPACGAATRDALRGAGGAVEFHSYPGMSHGSCPQEEEHVAAFLKRVLP